MNNAESAGYPSDIATGTAASTCDDTARKLNASYARIYARTLDQTSVNASLMLISSLFLLRIFFRVPAQSKVIDCNYVKTRTNCPCCTELHSCLKVQNVHTKILNA